MGKEFINSLEKLLRGEIKDFKTSELMSPDKAEAILLEFGFEEGDFYSKGWEWNFWKTYSREGEVYTLSGNGWCNTGLSFSKHGR